MGMSLAGRIVTLVLLIAGLANQASGAAPRKVPFAIRGVSQELYFFDPAQRKADAPACIVVSGDGGWHGFIAEVAQYLADRGHTAIGVDAKEYLASLSKSRALDPSQVTGDFATLARFAAEQAGAKSIVLAGWSEGAGLVILAGLDPGMRPDLHGVIAIGLPELNELAWRWTDAAIYITHKVPNEPTFNSKDYVGKLAPIPLLMIQSTHDDFVPLETARAIFARAGDPKQLNILDSANHRFDGQRPAFWQALDRALAWFESLSKSPR